MDWFFEGLTAAAWQIIAFISLLILAAAGLWSCNYLGINEGYAILSFYVGIILAVNLYLAWRSNNGKQEVSNNVD